MQYNNAYKSQPNETSMEKKEVTRKEIEAKLENVGDYVKLDYLQNCLKKQIDFDTRRFVLVKLASIYESRKMYLEAAKVIRSAADINATFDAKMRDFLKSTEFFIKAGYFDEADISLAKTLASASENQKVAIKIKVKEYYNAQAKEFIRKDKRRHAMETYEKILELDLNPFEKKEVQTNLLSLYQKLGKINEYFTLQRSM